VSYDDNQKTSVGKKLAQALVVALCLVGLYSLYGAVRQAREDYTNFRKIVVWVYQKQAQEEAARQRQAQQRQQAPPSSDLPDK